MKSVSAHGVYYNRVAPTGSAGRLIDVSVCPRGAKGLPPVLIIIAFLSLVEYLRGRSVN